MASSRPPATADSTRRTASRALETLPSRALTCRPPRPVSGGARSVGPEETPRVPDPMGSAPRGRFAVGPEEMPNCDDSLKLNVKLSESRSLLGTDELTENNHRNESHTNRNRKHFRCVKTRSELVANENVFFIYTTAQ